MMCLRNMLLIATLIFSVSCGVRTNGKKAFLEEKSTSLLLTERQCEAGVAGRTEIGQDIARLYLDFQTKYPLAFLAMPVRLYDYKNPLIINEKSMSAGLSRIREWIKDETYLQKNLQTVAIELYYLNESSVRSESNQCALSSLSMKKSKEIRPYLFMKDFCMNKENNPVCGQSSLNDLPIDEENFVRENTLKMCLAFNAKNVDCQAQYLIEKKKETLSSLVGTYQRRFKEEIFDQLFRLRSTHLKFDCLKEADKTIMQAKVLSVGWDREELQELTKFVSETWTRDNFELSIELVDKKGSDVIEIIPSNSPVSRVPDNNNRLVYLSQHLDEKTKKSVLAHEFGHVLGFPDCYTEFFDNQNKDLVYYEFSKDDTNIMCSLKSGVSVPDDYFNQLSQKSCLFN